jgi:hypothetical protein
MANFARDSLFVIRIVIEITVFTPGFAQYPARRYAGKQAQVLS